MGLKRVFWAALLAASVSGLGAEPQEPAGFRPWLVLLAAYQASAGPEATGIPLVPDSQTAWAPAWSLEGSYQALSPRLPLSWNQTPGLGLVVSGLTPDYLSYKLGAGTLMEIHTGTTAAFTEGFAAFPYAEAGANLALLPSEALRIARSQPSPDPGSWARLRQYSESAAARQRTEEGVAAFLTWSERTSLYQVKAALARTSALALRKLELQDPAGTVSRGALARAKAEARLAEQEAQAAAATLSSAERQLRAYLPPGAGLPSPQLGADVFAWAPPTPEEAGFLPDLPGTTRNEERYLLAQKQSLDLAATTVPQLKLGLTLKPTVQDATAANPYARDPWSAFRELSSPDSGIDLHLDLRLTIPLFPPDQELVAAMGRRKANYEWDLGFERSKRETTLRGLVSRLESLQTADAGLEQNLVRLNQETDALRRLRGTGDVTEVDVAWSIYDRELLVQQIQAARREAVSLGLEVRALLQKELVP